LATPEPGAAADHGASPASASMFRAIRARPSRIFGFRRLDQHRPPQSEQGPSGDRAGHIVSGGGEGWPWQKVGNP